MTSLSVPHVPSQPFGRNRYALHPDPHWLGDRLTEAGADRILFPVVTEGVRLEQDTMAKARIATGG